VLIEAAQKGDPEGRRRLAEAFAPHRRRRP